jgi:hypothetical protein
MKKILALLLFALLPIAIGGQEQGKVRATATAHGVTLVWTASTSTYTGLGYNVYRGSASGAEAATPVNSALLTAACTGTSCTYTDSNVTAQSSYYYTVAACVASTCSAMSNEASATVPLAGGDINAPSGLSGSAH